MLSRFRREHSLNNLQVNARYGATVRDATHVLDGLLYHESDLRIEEHYTGTAGFTDHVFGLCHLLGFRFAPRIRDLPDRRLYTAEKAKRYPTLQPFIGGRINLKQLLAQWSEILCIFDFLQAEAGLSSEKATNNPCSPTLS
jgi:TnpA family transposase